MKPYLFAAALLVGMIQAVHAQSLDIGGIELRLGQKVDEALQSLSPYQVQYSNGSWFVSQKNGNLYQVLGSIGAKSGVISYISKSFETNENAGAPAAYTRASREIRQRGGSTCTTHEVVYSDGLIHEFETLCGLYKLSYFMPMKMNDGTPVEGAVSLSISSR